MTPYDKKAIAAYRTAIRYIKKGYGGGHTQKHSFDFNMSCLECQALIVVSFLEHTIELIKTIPAETSFLMIKNRI